MVAGLPLPVGNLGGQRGIGGQGARELLADLSGFFRATRAVEQRNQAAAQRGVARFERVRAAGRLESALEVAQLFTDLAEQVPLDGAGVLRQRFRELRQRPARAGHFACGAPDLTAPLPVGRRDLVQERRQRGGTAGGDHRIGRLAAQPGRA